MQGKTIGIQRSLAREDRPQSASGVHCALARLVALIRKVDICVATRPAKRARQDSQPEPKDVRDVVTPLWAQPCAN